MELYPLKNGPSLPAEAVYLAQDLELKGVKLSAKAGSLVATGPNVSKPELSPDERARIVKWKLHLLALVEYCSKENPCVRD